MNYVLNEAKMFADITDGIGIIINGETGIYYGMNELATAVYENLTEGASAESILSVLKSMPESPEDMEKRFNHFIKYLVDKELIIEGVESERSVNINPELASESGFELEAAEYNDAQELLLADPIHEVKEETGWRPDKGAIGYTKEETIIRESKAEL